MAGLRTLSTVSLAGHYARWRSYVKLKFKGQQSVEKLRYRLFKKVSEARREKTRMKAEG
jgi:hypothetical protein